MLSTLKKSDDKGFTLIELLIVIAIIGILAAIAVPIFLSQQNGAQTAAAQSEASALETLVAANYSTYGTFGAGTGTTYNANGGDSDNPSIGSMTLTDGTYTITANDAAGTYCVTVTITGATAPAGTASYGNNCPAPPTP